jgi:cellulose biosynthesis protein BcsQ
MLDRRRKLHTEILDELPAKRRDVSSIAIPSASAVEQMAVRRMPLIAFAPHTAAAAAFGDLWAEVASILRLAA